MQRSAFILSGSVALLCCTVALVVRAAEDQSAKTANSELAKTTASSTLVEDGFVPLFPNDSFDAWSGSHQGYQVKDGIVSTNPKSSNNLYTKKEYEDFVLRFDFKLTPGANNGIGIRTPSGGRPSGKGIEIQVLDDTAARYKSLNATQYHGSIYKHVAAKRGHQKPVGQWNTQEIYCRGTHIRVTLNGTVIVDADISELSEKHKVLRPKAGCIVLCGHRTLVQFRNMRIKPL